MKTYNIRIVEKKENKLANIPGYLYEYMGFKFFIHKSILSIKNNEKYPMWKVTEFNTGMGFISSADSKKECYELIHDWFNVDDKESRIKLLDETILNGLRKYGKAN